MTIFVVEDKYKIWNSIVAAPTKTAYSVLEGGTTYPTFVKISYRDLDFIHVIKPAFNALTADHMPSDKTQL
jgi:hypothetical protein